MASDSASSNETSSQEVLTPKMIRHAGGGLIGMSGSWLVANLLFPLQKKKCEVSDMIDLIRSIKEGPYPDQLEDTSIMMVWPNRPIVMLWSGGQYVELKASYAAIGSGEDYALGFLEGAKDGIDGTVLKKAVAAAAKYSTSVGLPAKLLHVTKGSE